MTFYTQKQAMTPRMESANSRKYFGSVQTAHPDEDMRHDRSMFQQVGLQRSHFVVHPDWISEEFTAPKFKGRSHRPWPFEFPGARNWSGETADDRKAAEHEEKLQLRHSGEMPSQLPSGGEAMANDYIIRDQMTPRGGPGPYSAYMYQNNNPGYGMHPGINRYYNPSQQDVSDQQFAGRTSAYNGVHTGTRVAFRPSAGMSPRRSSHMSLTRSLSFSRYI